MAVEYRREADNPPMGGGAAGEGGGQQAGKGFLPRWVVMVLGVILVAAMMGLIAGQEAGKVFQTCIYMIFLVPVLGAAWMLGNLLTRPLAARGVFEGSPWPGGYRALVAVALGLGAFAIGTLLLGVVHLIEPGAHPMAGVGLAEKAGSPWPVVGLLVIGAAVGLLATREVLEKSDRRFIKGSAHRGDWLMLLAAVPAAMMLVAATFPPGSLWQSEGRGYDVMEYHLELPREYALNNSTAPVAHNVYSYFPSNVEMLYLLEMQIAKGVMGDGDADTDYVWGTYPAQFLHALLMLLTAAALAVIPLGEKARPWLNTTGRAVAVLLFLGVPWAIITGSLAYNEGGMLFFGTLALGAAMAPVAGEPDRSRTAQGVLVGVLLGLAVGCKMTAGVFFAVPVALVLVARGLLDGREGEQGAEAGGGGAGEAMAARLRSLALAVGVAVAVYLPWAARAAIASGGNPVFPIATSILPRDGWGPEQTARFNRGHSAPESQRTVAGRLKALVDNSVLDGEWSVQPYLLVHLFDAPPGAVTDMPWMRIGIMWVVVPLAVAAAFIRKPGRGESWVMLLALIVNLLAWLFVTHLQSRFLLPAAVPLALLVGRGAQGEGAAGGILLAGGKIFLSTLVVVHALCTVFLLLPEARLLGGTVPYQGRVPVQPIGAMFERLLNVAALVEHPDNEKLAAATPPEKVLLVGDAEAWRFIGPVEYYTVFDVNLFAKALAAGDPQQTLAWLQGQGIRYIWIDGMEIDRLRATYGFENAITPEAIAKLAQAGIVDTRVEIGGRITVLRVPGK